MICTACDEGELRVIIGKYPCPCKHPTLICDNCFGHFAILCQGTPPGSNEGKMPPELPIELSEKLTMTAQKMFGRRPVLRKNITRLPTLEEYKTYMTAPMDA